LRQERAAEVVAKNAKRLQRGGDFIRKKKFDVLLK
jgi:hypothetical protein